MDYTIIYTSSSYWGTLVHMKRIHVQKELTMYEAAAREGIDPGAIVIVFPGHQQEITQDFSTL